MDDDDDKEGGDRSEGGEGDAPPRSKRRLASAVSAPGGTWEEVGMWVFAWGEVLGYIT